MSALRATVGTALAEVPVNVAPLIDDTDFKTVEAAVAYNAAGMDLVWNVVTVAGAMTQTAVTPTTAGVHDWTNQGKGMYSLEIPASGGTINNDTIGFGWFSGVVTGVLPWRGPIIEFGVPSSISGTFSGTHTSTTSDLGTNAPANDITGMTLFNPTDNESRVITSYNTGTGVATHAAWDTAAGVSNTEPWLLFPTAPIDSVTLAAINAEADTALTDYAPALASVATEARLAELDAANLPADIAAIPTTAMRGTDGVDTAAMRGTDSAALASVATEARLAELDAANLPADVAAIPTTAMRGTDNAALASVATEARMAELDAANLPADVDAVLADTADMQPKIGAPAADLAADVAAVKAETALVVADTNELQTDWVDGGRLDLLLDRLITELDTARGEPGQGLPPASTKVADKVDYVYKWLRNRSNQTATAQQFFADDAITVDHKRTVSDDGTTFESSEMVTGP